MDESKPGSNTTVAPTPEPMSGSGSSSQESGRRPAKAGAKKLKRPSTSRLRIKLVGGILGVLVVVSLLSFGTYKLLHKKPQVTGHTAQSTMPAIFSTLTSQERVTYYLRQKNYTAAANIYNNQLKTAKTADDKAQANMGLCGVYTAKQDYPQAYQYALKAYNDEATVQTARTAAGAAQNAGDKNDAAKYYQSAIGLLQKENVSSDVYAYTLRVLQAQLKEVS